MASLGGTLALEPAVLETSLQILAALSEEVNSAVGASQAQDDEARRLWSACIIFIAKELAPGAPGRPATKLTLASILAAYNLSLADFLKELPVALKRAEPSLGKMLGPDLERRLKLREMQTSFVYTTVLAKKCRDLFRTYFNLPTGGLVREPTPFHLCWLLFIVAKAKLLPPYPDLVSSFHLLVCVINVFYAHVPPEARLVHPRDQQAMPVRDRSGGVDTLASLAIANRATLTHVRTLSGALNPLVDGLLVQKWHQQQGPAPAPEGLVTSCTQHRGFLTDPGLTAAVVGMLYDLYEQSYAAVSEIDERPFIEAKDTPPLTSPEGPKGACLGASPSMPPPSLTKCRVRTPLLEGLPSFSSASTPSRLLPSPLRPPSHLLKTPSPARRSALPFFGTPGGASPGTPLSEAMAATAWLQEIDAKMPSELSEDLAAFLDAAGPSVRADLERFVAEKAALVFSPEAAGGATRVNAALATEQAKQGAKLFWRVLEALLKGEQRATGRTDFQRLLASTSFHTCLLACALEMIVASYRMVDLAFPAVLERLQLQAFDFCKLVTPFVRNEPALPRQLKRHLFSIEERIIESLAWEPGSSIYPLLKSVCGGESTSGGSPPGPEGERAKTPSDSPEAGKDSPPERGSSSQNTPVKRGRDAPPLASPAKAARTDSNEASTAHHASPSRNIQGSFRQRKRGVERASPSNKQPQQWPGGVSAEVAEAAEALVAAGSGMSPRPSRAEGMLGALTTPLRASPAENGEGVGTSRSVLPHCFGRALFKAQTACQTQGHAVLKDFLAKVLKLAALRLADLCDRIDFEPLMKQDILSQVYTMVDEVVLEHTSLLYGRHLDQILLSSLYGVCKVNQLRQVTFKDIITHYKKQPQAKAANFRTVPITFDEPDMQVLKTGDVIQFYNAVFIPTVKTFVLLLGSGKAELLRVPPLSLPGTPARPQAGSNIFATPERRFASAGQLGARKVFLSPMRQSSPQAYSMPGVGAQFSVRLGDGSAAYSSPSRTPGGSKPAPKGASARADSGPPPYPSLFQGPKAHNGPGSSQAALPAHSGESTGPVSQASEPAGDEIARPHSGLANGNLRSRSARSPRKASTPSQGI